MKKVLFVATVVKTHINNFHVPYMKWFKDNGYEVSVAAKNDFLPKSDCSIPFCDKFYDMDFERFPFHYSNYLVYKKLQKIINDNKYEIVHCHTPVGGVIGRLAARTCKSSKVVYTAHGYHFYRGAPLLNWLLYYSIEKLMSSLTDDLILINKDDYKIALKRKMAKRVHYIPGVGIDYDKFSKPNFHVNKVLDGTKFNLTFIGELTKNKNQEHLIYVIYKLKNQYSDIMLNIVGDGTEKEHLINLINELKVEKHVNMLGFRKDIPQILQESQLIVSASLREGLPVNIMEAMASSKPVIVTNSRGNRDLIEDGINGYVVDFSVEMFAKKIEILIKNPNLRKDFSLENSLKAQQYDLEVILPKYADVYNLKG